ncbi:hypothetical protein ACERZ8_13440 [Tateyamaria armeniaca]|uniref:Uncharacterized protein n=1 Tax=Tateyamaria armeniaca TaxID=2518930 RepID=A0ABW8UV96_9RHOB
MRRGLSTIVLVLSVSAAAASAEPDRLNVDFGSFPTGTACKVHGTSGKVSLRTGREIEFKVRGDTGNVSFTCTQPDGTSFLVRTGPLLPQGNFRLVAIQINQDNHAHIFWDQGGLRRSTVPGILDWQ